MVSHGTNTVVSSGGIIRVWHWFEYKSTCSHPIWIWCEITPDSPSHFKFLGWIRTISGYHTLGTSDQKSLIIIFPIHPNGGCQTWFLKKTKNSNFGKKFLPYFLALKIDPEKRNFDIFCPRIFRKIAKTNSKLYCGQTTRKNENFKKLIFSFKSA